MQQSLKVNEIDITVEQWRILFYLWKEDGVNQQELALIAKKEKSTMTRQIDALEKKGLVERRNLSKDKRNKLIFLTEKGSAIENKSLEVAEKITQRSEEGITTEELKIFKNVLHKILKNLA